MLTHIAICPVDGCNLTVDVVLESSDGKLFGAHQQNLEMFTEGFPIAGSAEVSHPVPLEETAEVLELMLGYTHNTRMRSLDGLPFSLVVSLAEAVEKYMIYSAMEFCKMEMTCAIYLHPDDVFVYSLKHNYPGLADKAAELTLSNPVWDFLTFLRKAGLHEDLSFQWLRYRERWVEVFLQVVLVELTSGEHNKNGPKSQGCSTWSLFRNNVIEDIVEDPSELSSFDDIVKKHIGQGSTRCFECRGRSNDLSLKVKKRLKTLPKYSEA